jgi:hypothetical protein
MCKKACSDILPHFHVTSCLEARDILPPRGRAHYFTRNRTHGSVFPSVFLRAWEVPTIVPRCFRLLFWQQERIALRRWTGTISHEAGLWGLPVCLRDWKDRQRV